MKFHKYHALGNDYIVMDPAEVGDGIAEDRVRTVCHRNFGIGSDGILLGPLPSSSCEFGLRIFNPDGSEAERSGNGRSVNEAHTRAEFRETTMNLLSVGRPD